MMDGWMDERLVEQIGWQREGRSGGGIDGLIDGLVNWKMVLGQVQMQLLLIFRQILKWL